MVIFMVEMGYNQKPSAQNLLWAWRPSISRQKNHKSFVIGSGFWWVRYLLTTKIGKPHLPCSFFCHQDSWSCEVDCSCQVFGILSEFFKKITSICISVEIPIGEVDEPILTQKNWKASSMFFLICNQACWSCEVHCSCQREFDFFFRFLQDFCCHQISV